MNLPPEVKKALRAAAREEMDTVPVPVVGFKRLRPEENDLPLPAYQTPGASGMDLMACVPEREILCTSCYGISPELCEKKCNAGKVKVRNVILHGQSRILISTGFAIKLPPGYDSEVRSRSGLTLKEGVFVLNSPGTVDNDYVGEVKVILYNTSTMPFIVDHGRRIAQLVVAPVTQAAVQEIQDLPTTVRGEGGFGSTGQ